MAKKGSKRSKNVPAKVKRAAQNSGKKKRKPNATSFKLGNPWRFPKGKSGNPGGRPKLLSEAYREWLEAPDANGVTNASKVAINVGFRAAVGDVQSAKELRSATEGEKVAVGLSGALDLGHIDIVVHGNDTPVPPADPDRG